MPTKGVGNLLTGFCYEKIQTEYAVFRPKTANGEDNKGLRDCFQTTISTASHDRTLRYPTQ